MNIRLLYLTAETFPTFRADVNVLFGKVLPQRGIQSDIVAGKTPRTADNCVWRGAAKLISAMYLADLKKKHIKIFLHGIKRLLNTDTKQYQAIQVRDMPLLATIGLLVASSRD